MPRLGPDMDEGTLIEWNISVDDEVKEGAVLVTIESDKSEVELESRWDAVVAQLVVEPGTVVPVGGVIAILYEPGTDPGPLVVVEPSSAAKLAATPDPPVSVPVVPAKAAPAAAKPGGVKRGTSPLVRRMLKENGLSADEVTGTGPGGKIQRSDVEAAIAAKAASLAPTSDPAPVSDPAPTSVPTTGSVAVSTDPHRFVLTKGEKAAGRRMSEAKSTIPEFAVSRQIDMTAALATKKALAERGTPVSLNDILLFATARSLMEHPRINGVFEGDAVVARPTADVALAISTPDGLMAAVIPHCEQLSLVEIGSKSRELVERVLGGKLRPEDLDQGTFTVSNLGMHGVDRFQPIINPPHVAIMGVGRVADHLVLNSLGVPMAVPMIEITMVGDHRAVDGVALAKFLSSVDGYVSGYMA